MYCKHIVAVVFFFLCSTVPLTLVVVIAVWVVRVIHEIRDPGSSFWQGLRYGWGVCVLVAAFPAVQSRVDCNTRRLKLALSVGEFPEDYLTCVAQF